MKTKNLLKPLIIVLFFIVINSQTKAQIVYTDIDPDTTIYKPNVQYLDSNATYAFDLNIDGPTDFSFRARHYSYQIQEGTILSIHSIENKITGGCTEFGERNDIYFNDTINQNLIWNNSATILIDVFALPMYCAMPVGDIYFGLKLVIGTDAFYGWVRCTATDTSITIKDYAYNTIPDMYILAGQTIIGIDTLSPIHKLNIYENNNYLWVTFNNFPNPIGHIKIYNNIGQLINNTTITGYVNSISLSGITAGIYIVNVETQIGSINRQIYLQSN